jgi:hypothetical protein
MLIIAPDYKSCMSNKNITTLHNIMEVLEFLIVVSHLFTKRKHKDLKIRIPFVSFNVHNGRKNKKPCKARVHILSDNTHYLVAWCSNCAEELSTASCQAVKSFFWAVGGRGSSYLFC